MKEAGLTLGVLCILALSVAGIMHREDEQNKAFLRITQEQRILADREIYDYTPSTDGTVSYTYYGEKLPEKLHEREIVERRTEVADHYVVRDIDERTREVRATFYLTPVRAIDDKGVWRTLQNATTTESAWNLRPQTLAQKIEDAVMPTANAAITLVTSGAGDVSNNTLPAGACNGAKLNTARNAASGNAVNPAASTISVGWIVSDNGPIDCSIIIFRGFLPYDTSSIPSSFPVTSAQLSVDVGYGISTDKASNDFILASTSQGIHTTLVVGDYSKITRGIGNGINSGGTTLNTDGCFPVACSSVGFHTWDIDPSYLSEVKRNGEASNCSATPGITCIGLRSNLEGTFSAGEGLQSYINIDIASTSPLSTNYVDSSFAFWQFQDF